VFTAVCEHPEVTVSVDYVVNEIEFALRQVTSAKEAHNLADPILPKPPSHCRAENKHQVSSLPQFITMV
jgi:hypothetical protein